MGDPVTMDTMTLDQLEALALAEEQAAKAVELSDDERRRAAAIERVTLARETRAANERARRGLDLDRREGQARAKMAAKADEKGVLVKGVDLVDLFAFGTAPAASDLPGGGVIVVRSPKSADTEAFQLGIESKQKAVAVLAGDLLCASTVDPDMDTDAIAGAKMRAFCDRYPLAAQNAGDVVLKLGGMKLKADKRGRS